MYYLSKQSGGQHLYLGVAGTDRSINGSDIIICMSPDKPTKRTDKILKAYTTGFPIFHPPKMGRRRKHLATDADLCFTLHFIFFLCDKHKTF